MRPGARGLQNRRIGPYVWLLFVSFRQSRPALVQTIAFSVHFQNADVVGQSVQQSASETFRAEGIRPFLKWRLLVISVDVRSVARSTRTAILHRFYSEAQSPSQ